jgi:hypothetical protein
VNSFRFYDSSSPQAKFLKGAEENQVERNVLVGMVDAASHSTYGTQRTMEEFHPSVYRKQFVAQAMFCVLDLPAIFVSYGYIQVTSIYTKYTCNIHNIYNVYPIEIFCIYSLNLFDMHGIYMVYVMLIHSLTGTE